MITAFLCLSAVAIDGDTLRCAGVGRVRLAAIDAPEMPGHCRHGRACVKGDPFASRDTLAALIAGERVRCRVVDASSRRGFQDRDPYGRPVARCSAGGVDLSEAQLGARMAKRWGRRNRAGDRSR